MSSYTTNLNLIKPDYDDNIDVQQLNNNSDVIDTQINNVINVNNNQNRQIDTLSGQITNVIAVNDNQNRQIDTLSGRVTTLENKKYPDLPLTGGNFTGDLTVNEKTLVYVLDKLVDDTNEKYKITAIKYSDGTLKQTITSKIQNDSVYTTVTFLVPFTNVDDITLTCGAKLPATDDYKLPFNGSFKSVAELSTTGAKFHFANAHMYWDYIFIGYWK